MTQAFNLSQFANKVNTSGLADLTTAVTGTLPVANGGTGAATLTVNNVVLGNGTSAVNFVAPSTSGNVLTSNGTTWVSGAGSSGVLIGVQAFTITGTYTPTSGTTVALIYVWGAGGGGGTNGSTGGSGGTTSFGALISCTGGIGGLNATPANGGTATGGTLNFTGQKGFGQSFSSKISVTAIGCGGSSNGFGNSNLGQAATFAGGGSGFMSSTSAQASGGGGGGNAQYRYVSPVAQTVTIGAGGAGAGTSGNNSAGGAGLVLIYEYK